MGRESEPVRVAIMGLGFIGRLIARCALRTPALQLVAAIDQDPALAGKPLSELVPEAPKGLRIQSNSSQALKDLREGVLLLDGVSRFEKALPTLEAAARAGVNVVSTCEELAFPWLHYEQKADALDQLARSRGVAILGTGVNPGFVLDRLAVTAGAVCGPVEKVEAIRVVDVRSRHEALQRRVGMGLSPEEFERRAADGELGHVGLEESAALLALGLGIELEETEEELAPIIAQEDLPGSPALSKGQVTGIFQQVRGFEGDQERVRLELTIAAGVDEVFDRVRIEAEPKLDLKVEGGYAGDEATAWAVVNAATRISTAEAGILTVLELPAGR